MLRLSCRAASYTNSRSTALAALTFEGVCLSYCRHPCSGACFQAPSGRRLTPFTGITGCTGCAGQAGISRFPVRGGRAAPRPRRRGCGFCTTPVRGSGLRPPARERSTCTHTHARARKLLASQNSPRPCASPFCATVIAIRISFRLWGS